MRFYLYVNGFKMGYIIGGVLLFDNYGDGGRKFILFLEWCMIDVWLVGFVCIGVFI